MNLVVNGKVSETVQKYAIQLASFLGCSEKTAIGIILTRGNELHRAQRTLARDFGDSFKDMSINQIANFIKGLDSRKIKVAKKMQELGILKDYFIHLDSPELEKRVLNSNENCRTSLKTISIFSDRFTQNAQTACFA